MTESTPQINEKATYRARGPLFVGSARAANAGDLVHGSVVLANGWSAEDVELVDEEQKDLVPPPPPVPTTDEVLAEVGKDKRKAAAALEAEQAKGHDARPDLVAALEKLAAG